MNKRIIDCGDGMKNSLWLGGQSAVDSRPSFHFSFLVPLSLAYWLFIPPLLYLLWYNEAYEQCCGRILTLIYAIALKSFSTRVLACVCVFECVSVTVIKVDILFIHFGFKIADPKNLFNGYCGCLSRRPAFFLFMRFSWAFPSQRVRVYVCVYLWLIS